jgi:FkbM family methyltransferase
MSEISSVWIELNGTSEALDAGRCQSLQTGATNSLVNRKDPEAMIGSETHRKLNMLQHVTGISRGGHRHSGRSPVWLRLVLGCALAAAGCANKPAPAGTALSAGPAPVYSTRPASRDGIGKVYMGREISFVMGHQGADWLERPSRQQEERTDLLLENLPLRPDSVVADIGAGTGYFSLAIARRVPEGRVLAVDIQPEMLTIIKSRMATEKIANVVTVLAGETDPHLPAGQVDLALLVDAYHEFSHPREVMLGIVAGLRPGGLVALVEYRAEDPEVPILTLHKMSEAQARLEMSAVGLEWVETRNALPQQHLMIFRKPATAGPAGT